MEKIDTLLGKVGDFLNNPTVLTIFALAAGIGLVLLLLMHPRAFDRPKDKQIDLIEWLGLTGSFVTERYRPMGRAIMVVIVLVCGVLVASGMMAMIGLWQALWSIITAGPEHVATNETVRGYAFALAAIFGLPFLVWRSVVAQQQAVVAQKQADVSEQNHITDRISKAVEQLGAEKEVKAQMEDHLGTATQVTRTLPNIEVRIGGIYALERIAQDSLRDHVQIMEILCAYIIENAPSNGAKEVSAPPTFDFVSNEHGKFFQWMTDFPLWQKKTAKELDVLKPRTDIMAALKVIGRRSSSQIEKEIKDIRHHKDGYRLDLRNSNLQGADLRRQNFERALFAKSRLEGVNFVEAELSGAYFKWAHLQLTDFTDAVLKGATLIDSEMQGTILTDANLQEVDLNGAQLQCVLFNNATMRNAAIRKTDLRSTSGISQEKIDQMFGDNTTILPVYPEGITRPHHWPKNNLTDEEFHKQWTALKNKPS